MQPEAKKTALYFHAKDDLPEVRREVFKLLQRHPIRFSAVIRDKKAVLDYVRSRNERDSAYRYEPNELYDNAVRRLFKERLHKHDGYNICFAIRGNSHRTTAFRQALELARDRFARERGLAVTGMLNVKTTYPTAEPALQAVDYFLWALQRTYEKREDRFLELVWPQCSLIVGSRIRRLLYKAKAAEGSGFESWLRDIGSTRLGALLTRHRADFCPSNR